MTLLTIRPAHGTYLVLRHWASVSRTINAVRSDLPDSSLASKLFSDLREPLDYINHLCKDALFVDNLFKTSDGLRGNPYDGTLQVPGHYVAAIASFEDLKPFLERLIDEYLSGEISISEEELEDLSGVFIDLQDTCRTAITLAPKTNKESK